MKEIIESSRNIIARSGYTTIMELVSLNCTGIDNSYTWSDRKGILDKISFRKGMVLQHDTQGELKGNFIRDI